MGTFSVFTTRLATILVLHAAGAGYASPTVLVTRPASRVALDWLPTDNQTVYRLGEGESRSLELNTSSIIHTMAFITISPCSNDFQWALYSGRAGNPNGHLSLKEESKNSEVHTISVIIMQHNRYVLRLSSSRGGAVVVSVRGEATMQVRMRLRVRSRRRLAANWEPSPPDGKRLLKSIDSCNTKGVTHALPTLRGIVMPAALVTSSPTSSSASTSFSSSTERWRSYSPQEHNTTRDPQETTYCVVASRLKNYTSLCAAQFDIKAFRENKLRLTSDNHTKGTSTELDNQIEPDSEFNLYEGNYKSVYRKKKFGRSTRVTDEDPVIACVGDRTHHLIENLDTSATYFVSVFGVGKDRRSGSLLASGKVCPKTSTAKRLRENMPKKFDVRGRSIYYFKTTMGSGEGIWLMVSTCGGAVDVEVLARGKRLHLEKNIDPQKKFFVPSPIPSSSIQETSDEGSVQFDSSSEEAKMRYVIKIVPSRWNADRDGSVNVELTASTTRWGINSPELLGDVSNVRELRPQRSCKSVDIAFLPASHNATDVIRYCIITREIVNGEHSSCLYLRRSSAKTTCINHTQTNSSTVIVQKIAGLKPGRKYVIHVVAAFNKGSPVPYNVLYVDTNVTCKDD